MTGNHIWMIGYPNGKTYCSKIIQSEDQNMLQENANDSICINRFITTQPIMNHCKISLDVCIVPLEKSLTSIRCFNIITGRPF